MCGRFTLTTPADQLPPQAARRIGLAPHQVNALVRIVIRHPTHSPNLSRAAFSQLKTVIQNQPGVDIDIKRRTLVGIDRCISRLGQAAHRARRWLPAEA